MEKTKLILAPLAILKSMEELKAAEILISSDWALAENGSKIQKKETMKMSCLDFIYWISSNINRKRLEFQPFSVFAFHLRGHVSLYSYLPPLDLLPSNTYPGRSE